ncbi:MAG: hypothetical protein VCG02_05025, partial [Verrucomicrobiota bacterium]
EGTSRGKRRLLVRDVQVCDVCGGKGSSRETVMVEKPAEPDKANADGKDLPVARATGAKTRDKKEGKKTPPKKTEKVKVECSKCEGSGIFKSEEPEEHLIPMGKHVVVFNGDHVSKGQQLTEGPVIPHEILEVCGPEELQEYLVNEVQAVYRLQGVEINDKHIEIIVRQMLRKVRITDSGDTPFLWGEQIEKLNFEDVNKQAKEEGRRPAQATPVLLGITKAALETESFISAASFQDTTRVLTEAAALGKKDFLRGFKENVIMGHLIPAGTGFEMYRNIKLKYLGEPVSAEEMLGDGFLEDHNSSEI